MTDFLSYLVFMVVGMVVAAFLGYFAMLRVWSLDRDSEKKGWLDIAIAAIATLFMAGR